MKIGKTYANTICYEIPHENIPKIKLRKVRPGALRTLGIKLHVGTRGTRAVPVKQWVAARCWVRFARRY